MMTQRGIVYTFYSFKGGVGRSMALANVAALLAKGGYKVLIIDWDLEAPGLEKYFSNKPSYLSKSRAESQGIVDIINAYLNKSKLDWRQCIIQAFPFKDENPISIITAGKESNNYVSLLQNINWENLFNEKNFGTYLEQLREEWVSEYDFILIDSRTGITDIGGICTIHLPDALVLFFTANEQSVEGVLEVVQRAWAKHKFLPLDRSKLLAVPVPSRFENLTEYKLASKWKSIFAQRLSSIYKDWLPDHVTASDILEKLIIPYVPYWSFGEGLPVVEEGTSDPRTLGFSYDILARLLGNRLQWKDALRGEIALSDEITPERINKDSEAIFESFNYLEQEKIKDIFLRLVRVYPPNEGEDTIRKLKKIEFEKSQQILIGELITKGLLIQVPDILTKETLIQINQSSLVKNWDRLRNWIDENREFLIWRQDINNKAKEWKNNAHDSSLTLMGESLSKAEQIKHLRYDEFNELERDYIVRSNTAQRYKRLRKYIPYVIAMVIIEVVVLLFYIYKKEQNESIILEKARLNQQMIQNARLQEMIKEQSYKLEMLRKDSLRYLINKRK